MAFKASTKMGGKLFAFPDVCRTPTPAGPVPLPYPNLAQLPAADATTCAQRVKILNQPVVTVATRVPRTQGDEAGSGGGVVAGVFGGPAMYRMGHPLVSVEGKAIATELLPTAGNQNNAPVGLQDTPSQGVVTIG